ncbi:hypothetical protein L1987_14286 [Smallanthus sonchifolius]|uniref:Uncharacterized protein n=1 Tax=Smallanthus sonchifolius TaxID=185202 RepID=A0ACB9J2G4_9ASTR|nr:hypothetical protein L1987_14286 [Smallanthus sonchifolius]
MNRYLRGFIFSPSTQLFRIHNPWFCDFCLYSEIEASKFSLLLLLQGLRMLPSKSLITYKLKSSKTKPKVKNVHNTQHVVEGTLISPTNEM